MRLCIPTVDDRGLESRPDDHFGSAPFFTLVDVDGGAFETVPNRERHHGHGTCRPLSQLDERRLDGIVCRGLGRRAAAALEASGLAVFVSDAPSVGAILEEARRDVLRRRDPGEACAGHGAGHRHRRGREGEGLSGGPERRTAPDLQAGRTPGQAGPGGRRPRRRRQRHRQRSGPDPA